MSDFRRRLMIPIYEEIPYIIAPQKAYIDTGVTPTANYKFITKFEIINTNTWTIYANDSAVYRTTVRLFQESNKLEATFGGSAKSNSTLSKNTVYTVEHSKTSYLTVNGNSNTYKVGTGNSLSSQTLKLFYSQWMLASSGNYQYFNGNKFYSQQIYNGTTLVRDFIPCILIQDTDQTSDGNMHYANEIGLWDKVNDKFYGSSGSASFTV